MEGQQPLNYRQSWNLHLVREQILWVERLKVCLQTQPKEVSRRPLEVKVLRLQCPEASIQTIAKKGDLHLVQNAKMKTD